MGAYLHSTPTVVVPAHLAPYLWRTLNRALDDARHQDLPVPDELVELVMDLTALGQWHEIRHPPTSDPLPITSDIGNLLALDPSSTGQWVTTATAAERLDVTPRRILQLLDNGTLRGCWDGGIRLIDPHTITLYAERKATR